MALTRSGRLLMAGLGAVLLVVALVAAGLYWFFSGDSVRVALERQATDWLGQPVRIGRAAVRFLPRAALRLDDVRVGEPMKMTLARVDLSTDLRSLLARRIEDAEVVISGSRIDLPLPFSVAVLAAPATPAAPAGAPAPPGGIETVSIGAITLRDVVITSRGREVRVSADSALAGSRLTISSFTARSGGTELSAHGVVDLAPRGVATIEAVANQLDFDDLLTLAAAFTTSSGTTASSAKPVQISAKVTAPRARVVGVPLARFEAEMLSDGTEVRIEPVEFDVFGGRYDGWLDATFGETLDVRIGAGVSNIDVGQLAAHGGAPDTIAGRLYGSGRFGARGRTMADVLSAARGVGEIKIAPGTIRNLDVVRTVVLFFGRPAAAAGPAPGERFDSISATFALADRSVRSDDLTLHSPDFDIFGRGTLALSDQAVDVRADLVLSESLSAQAGRDLYRFTRAGNRIVLPAIIGGSLGQPQVRIDAGAVIRRGLGNEIERRLQELFERIPN